jgi:hypothetical protein
MGACGPGCDTGPDALFNDRVTAISTGRARAECTCGCTDELALIGAELADCGPELGG